MVIASDIPYMGGFGKHVSTAVSFKPKPYELAKDHFETMQTKPLASPNAWIWHMLNGASVLGTCDFIYQRFLHHGIRKLPAATRQWVTGAFWAASGMTSLVVTFPGSLSRSATHLVNVPVKIRRHSA